LDLNVPVPDNDLFTFPPLPYRDEEKTWNIISQFFLKKKEKTFVDNGKGMCVKIRRQLANLRPRGTIMAAEEIKVYSTPT
jgi:hypothetical protein